MPIPFLFVDDERVGLASHHSVRVDLMNRRFNSGNAVNSLVVVLLRCEEASLW
jgi:hypothetical protein